MVLKLYVNHEALVRFLQGGNSIAAKITYKWSYDTEIFIDTNEYDIDHLTGASEELLTIQKKRTVI